MKTIMAHKILNKDEIELLKQHYKNSIKALTKIIYGEHQRKPIIIKQMKEELDEEIKEKIENLQHLINRLKTKEKNEKNNQLLKDYKTKKKDYENMTKKAYHKKILHKWHEYIGMLYADRRYFKNLITKLKGELGLRKPDIMEIICCFDNVKYKYNKKNFIQIFEKLEE